MNSLNKEEEEETYPLLSISSSHTTVRDNRTPRQKQLAVYLILASLLFESFGFYTVIANLIPSMTPNTPRTWEAANVLIASFIFTGKQIFNPNFSKTIVIVWDRYNLFFNIIIRGCQ